MNDPCWSKYLPRWYWLVGIGVPVTLLAATFALHAAAFSAMHDAAQMPVIAPLNAPALYAAVDRWASLNRASGRAAQFFFYALPAAAIWLCWFCPYQDIARAKSSGNLFERLRYTRISIATIPVGTAIIGLVLTVGMPLMSRIEIGHFEWEFEQSIGLTAVIATVPLAFIAAKLDRQVRILAQRASPSICHACGYDLRGSPGPICPECGEYVKTIRPSPG